MDMHVHDHVMQSQMITPCLDHSTYHGTYGDGGWVCMGGYVYAYMYMIMVHTVVHSGLVHLVPMGVVPMITGVHNNLVTGGVVILVGGQYYRFGYYP